MHLSTRHGPHSRASYLYLGARHEHGHLLARAVLDCIPEPFSRRWVQRGQSLEIAIPVGWYTSCTGMRCVRLFSFTLPMPHIRYGFAARHPWALGAYKLPQRFWYAVASLPSRAVEGK